MHWLSLVKHKTHPRGIPKTKWSRVFDDGEKPALKRQFILPSRSKVKSDEGRELEAVGEASNLHHRCIERESRRRMKRQEHSRQNDHDETSIKKATTASVIIEDDGDGNKELIAAEDSAAEPDASPNKHNSYAMGP